jgi:hypothetical protein
MPQPLTPRERRRLQQAHEDGYLDAASSGHRALVKAHGLWCWRMKLPLVWFERRSPHSRFAILRLDMMTTPNVLTEAGRAAVDALGEGLISAHDAVWELVPRGRVAKMAHAAFRAAIQVGNYRLNRVPAKIDARRAKSLKLVARKMASA